MAVEISNVSVGLILAVMVGFFCSSEGYVFVVGGKDGWVRRPSEGYNQWAGRYRFQVNDSLRKSPFMSFLSQFGSDDRLGAVMLFSFSAVFKYPKGADSVLIVTRDDYASCNTKSPLVSLTGGDSLFTFDRSGPFFFISGNPDNCNSGQKLIVIVLAHRTKAPTPESPSPATPSPSGMLPPPAAPSPASPPQQPGTDPSDMNPGPQALAPSPGFAPAGCSCSGAVVLGLSGVTSYLLLGKVLV